MAFRRAGIYAIVAVLMALVVAALLFAGSAWSQQGQKKEKRSAQTRERVSGVSPEQQSLIESLSQDQTEEELVQAAQASNAAGDLEGEPVEVFRNAQGQITRIIIDGENCTVGNNATVTFLDNDGDDVVLVVNGEGARIDDDPNSGGVRIRGESNGAPIKFAPDNVGLSDDLTVLASSGIDCDGDNNDGFDDDLLLALLLQLLDDDNNNNDNNDGNNNRRDRDDRFRERVTQALEDEGLIDEDGDGDIDQNDESLDAENDLNGDDEITDSEFTGAGHLRLVLGLQLRYVRRVGVLVLEPHLGMVVLDRRKDQDYERNGTELNALGLFVESAS